MSPEREHHLAEATGSLCLFIACVALALWTFFGFGEFLLFLAGLAIVNFFYNTYKAGKLSKK